MFDFTAPPSNRPDRKDPAPATPVQEPAGGDEQFTLLLVDDEPNVLKSLQRIFLEQDLPVLTAADGREALALLKTRPVHLVISDHRMPGLTGVELLSEIKQQWPETCRIMLTGHGDAKTILAAVNQGAVHKFITKPWNDDDLRLTVSLVQQQHLLRQENRQLKELAQKQEEKIKAHANRLGENRSSLDSILLKAGLLTKLQLDRAQKARKGEELLSDTLTRLKILSEDQIAQALQKQLKLEYVALESIKPNPAAVKFLPRDLCQHNRLLPVRMEKRQLIVAMADPSDMFKLDTIGFMTGLHIVPLIARTSDILRHLQQVYGERPDDGGPEVEVLADLEPADEIDLLLDEEDDQTNLPELIDHSQVPQIVRVVNTIISESIRAGASDIHIEPKTRHVVVRYRIDGLLHSKIKLPLELHPAVISRLKILAKMDIAERRVPQDGRIAVKTGNRSIDIRVSSMPTINGEKMVMRILDKSASIKRLAELGVLAEDLARIETLIKKPQGMLVCTGPTGSGKTTMLYSILNTMLTDSKNYQTIEDPVEYFLDQANQVYVRDKIGLSFAQVLRATLRQDPDVLLVGEIRDAETADVAFKAALTGHMVLTSLHTNNSVASITRLMDMGVKPYLIASAMEGIIAQRLVRKLCPNCREETTPNPDLVRLLNSPAGVLGKTVFKARGCQQCDQTGYKGRLGVFEFFLMNDDFRHFVSSSSYKEAKLLEMARAGGMLTLLEDGLRKVAKGLTTLDELVRVIGPQTRFERQCEACQRLVDIKFLYCPYCGIAKRNFCLTCMQTLEDEWQLCPTCGQRKDNPIPT